MVFDPGKFGFAGVLRCRVVGLPLTPESGEKTRVFSRSVDPVGGCTTATPAFGATIWRL